MATSRQKKSTTKHRNSKNRRQKNPTASKIKFYIFTGLKLIFAGTLLVCLFLLIKYGKMTLDYKDYAAKLVSDTSAFKSSLTTIVYDSNGETIANLCAEKDSYYLDGDEIPYLIKRAFITSEDRKFY